MKYEEIALNKITFVGIAVRTTNKEGQSQNDIGQLWDRFIQENIVQMIPNKISDDVYCVYTDYESDFMGEYTTIIGCQVSATSGISDQFTIKEIPACSYRKYTAKGKIPDCVGQTWMHIWESDIDRKYLADFDVYGRESQDQENATVTTYLSIN